MFNQIPWLIQYMKTCSTQVVSNIYIYTTDYGHLGPLANSAQPTRPTFRVNSAQHPSQLGPASKPTRPSIEVNSAQYGKPFWTKAVEFFSDGREFSRTVENFLGRSRIFSDGRDFKFSQTIENA